MTTISQNMAQKLDTWADGTRNGSRGQSELGLDVEDTGYVVAQFSGAGNVTGPIVPIDYTGPPSGPGASTSGCEEEDFPANPAPNSIALVQRGDCVFVEKIENARDAGDAAVLIANDGVANGPDPRIEPFQVSAPKFTPIPAAMISSTVGLELLAAAGQNLTFAVDATTEATVQYNLIADTPTGNPERTTVVGAHLDSVEEGPGINATARGRARSSKSPRRSPSSRATPATAFGSLGGVKKRPDWSGRPPTWPIWSSRVRSTTSKRT